MSLVYSSPYYPLENENSSIKDELTELKNQNDEILSLLRAALFPNNSNDLTMEERTRIRDQFANKIREERKKQLRQQREIEKESLGKTAAVYR